MRVVKERIGQRELVYTCFLIDERDVSEREHGLREHGLRTSAMDACTAAAVAPSERRFWCSSRDQDFSM
jgi:hypothetical protein